MEIFFIAFALSMDSVALSIANGAKCSGLNFIKIVKIAFYYALFQSLMTCAGYFLGLSFVEFIRSIDHFIAFFILVFLGIKMIKESRNSESSCTLNLNTKELILGAIATSIDAMAVGVTFAFDTVDIVNATIIIGVVCFVLCVLACHVGKKLGEFLEDKALILGGIILIFIGFKILLTHLEIINF